MCDARGVKLDAEMEPPVSPALADEERLRQIAINLLSNAVKFTPTGGRIAASCEDAHGEIVVRVSDTGDGIPSARLESIFDPFVQLGRRLNTPAEGMGLGLAIARGTGRLTFEIEADRFFRAARWLMGTRLKGTVALVTGASSGIGDAAARALAAEGATVALVARRKDRLDALAAKITNGGGKALAIGADVTNESEARDAVERAVRELGRLDTVVNNAGVMLLGPVVDAPIEEWERMIHLNLLGLLYVAHAALPHLLKAAESEPRRVADLVNISSVAGRAARSGSGVYNMTKFGVGAFSESLRQEVTRRHVRVSIVEPGVVATELTDHLRPEIREQVAPMFANTERLESEDIADAIAYIVTRPRHVAVNEILVRPTEQER